MKLVGTLTFLNKDGTTGTLDGTKTIPDAVNPQHALQTFASGLLNDLQAVPGAAFVDLTVKRDDIPAA